MSLLLTRSGYTSGLLSRVIDNGYDVLGFNPEYSDIYGAWLVRKRPLLDGTVYDETPSRKDRQELSARATSFATNQYFNGAVDIAGWTEFSISCWIRHGAVANNSYAMGSYGATSANRAFIFGVLLVSDAPYLSLYNNSGVFDARITFPANSTDDNEWHLLTATYDFATETMTGYIDGRDVTAASSVTAGTNGSINTSQNPSDFTIGTLLQVPTSFDWNGQLQLPMLYEGIWTPSEVRDLYLQNYENVTSPTYAWFLDGDTAHSIAGSSSLTASNSPTRYEDQQSPDWLNMQGWNFGNKLRLTKTPESGDSFTLRIKTTDTNFIFLNGSANNTIYYDGVAATSGPNAFSGGTTAILDGVDISSYTRLQLSDAISDNVEHELVITKTAFTNWGKVEVANYNFGNGSLGGLANGYVRLTHINGVAITADDIDFDNTTVLAPKVFSANQDTGGYAGNDNSFGDCKRNWQLNDGPAINLDGVNQYGSAGDDDIFSFGDGVTDTPFSVSCKIDVASLATQGFLSKGTNTTSGNIEWRLVSSSGGRIQFAMYDDTIANGIYAVTDAGAVSTSAREILGTYDGSGSANGITIYVDGVAPAQTTGGVGTYVAMHNTSTPVEIGVAEKDGSDKWFGGQIWDVRIYDSEVTPSTMDSVDPIAHWPISEQTGTTSYDISGNQNNIEWVNSPTWDSSANDNYFWSEAKGYSSVPIFEDGIALFEPTDVNFDGVKTCVIELDYYLTNPNTNQVLLTVGYAAPFYFRVNSGSISLIYRDGASITRSSTLLSGLLAGSLHRHKVTIIEDEDNPTTASSIVIIDRVTGEVLGSATGLDIGMSSATTNSGDIQLGNYANESLTFLGDLYRARFEMGGVEKLLWTSDNYLVNQTDDSAMTESGGTLETRLIPAKSDGSADANGYPLTNPAGPYHNDSQALLEEFPVTNSDSQGDVFYAAGFNGTLNSNINADTAITGFPFSLECDFKMAATAGTDYLVSISPVTSQYFCLQKVSGGEIRALRRAGGGSTATASSLDVTAGQWHSLKCTFESATDLTFIFDGVTKSFTGEDSVEHITDAGAGDLFIGQFRSSLGENPELEIKNVIVKQGDTIVNNMPLYKDALDRSDNNFHGTVTDANFLFESRELDLNPTIAQTNTRAVTTGDRSIVRIGPKAAFAGNDVALLVQGDAVVPAIFDKDVAITPIDFGAETTGGGPAYIYTISAGALPTGLTIDASTGIISGTPTVAEVGSFTVRATDFYGSTASSSSFDWQSSSVPLAISSASTAMSINDAQETGGVWLSDVTPTLAGVVQDETLERKDRTRLSCRASDFAVNQYFNGPVDIAGWTEFSISCWIRHGEVVTGMYAMGSYGSTTSNRTFFFGVSSSEQPHLNLLDNSGASDVRLIFPANTTNDNSWHLLTATYDYATNTAKGYIDGRDVTAASTVVAGTNGSINTTQDPDDFTIGTLLQVPTTFDWNGQLQQPLIYEGIWTAAEVRDLYLQQTDDIPTTYGWFLDGDSANGLTSASPALTPTNSPNIYEDDAIGGGDWLNEKGWNGAAEFNGTSSYISLGDDDAFSFGDSVTDSPFSVEVKVKADSFGSGKGGIIGNADSSGSQEWILMFDDTGRIKFVLYDNVASNNIQQVADSVLTVSTDYEILATYDGSGLPSGMTVYVNGSVLATSPVTSGTYSAMHNDNCSLTVGGTFWNDGLARWFDGTIKNVRLYDTECTPTTKTGLVFDLPLLENSEDVEASFDGTDTDVTYVPIPKRWDEELDSLGNAADNSNSFGVARRDGQLVDGACISLNGVNQYGTITNTDDFSASDWTLSGYAQFADVTQAEAVFEQIGSGDNWLRCSASAWRTSLDGGAAYAFSLATPLNDTPYYFGLSHDATANEVTLSITNLLTGVTESETTSATMTSASTDFEIGRFASGVHYAEADIWGLKLDHANGFELPIAEGSGDISYDVSGNGKNCTWQNSPTWGNQSQYFWNENQGCSAIWDVTSATDAAAGPEIVGAPIESGVTLSFEIKTTDTIGILFGNVINNPYFLYWYGGNSTTSFQSSVGTPTTKVDGVAFVDGVNTRGELSDAIATGEWVSVELTNLDLSQFSNGLFLSGYPSGSLRWDGQVRNLVINGEPYDGPLLIPALADGSVNDANGGALTNPAGPWLYEGLGSTYVNFDVVANANQWLEQRWIDASFNGTTSYLDTTNNFHWANAFDVAMRITQLGVGSGRLIGSSSNGNYSHRSSGLTTRTKINGTELVTTAVFTSNVEYLTEFSYTGGNDGTITASINGDSSSLVNDAVSVPNNAKLRIGANNTFSAFTELSARGFAANNNGAEWVDMPLLGCSLDLSSNVNHGTDTDVVYNRLTDVSYQAGDTVEQPFSVSTTGNKVYDLVKFTFPVTT